MATPGSASRSTWWSRSSSDGSESGDSLCLEADVLQGDTRIDDKRVTLSLDPGPSPDTPRVHMRTTRAIEEPVVTVKLSAGCATKSTRQYRAAGRFARSAARGGRACAAAAQRWRARRASPGSAIAGPAPLPPPIARHASPGPDSGRAAPSAAAQRGRRCGRSRAGAWHRHRCSARAASPSQRKQPARRRPRPKHLRRRRTAEDGKPRLKVEALAPEPVRDPVLEARAGGGRQHGTAASGSGGVPATAAARGGERRWSPSRASATRSA